ncbi:MAG: hypothetical protein IKR70_05455 [Lachnospiraceae bacterium]|nr:hypothetical protein [Lachnospiraceae bacterium]
MKIIKNSFVAAIVIAAVFALTGCGKETIQGDWQLVKEVDADGTVYTQEDLEDMGVAESYHIEEDVVSYTCHVMGQDISFDMDLVDTGNNQYQFKLKDMVFATVTLKGDTFTYTVEGEAESDIMYFERIE